MLNEQPRPEAARRDRSNLPALGRDESGPGMVPRENATENLAPPRRSGLDSGNGTKHFANAKAPPCAAVKTSNR